MKYKSLAFSIIFLAISTLFGQSDKNIAVIGTGYVGLVTGAGLAEFGNYVTCADIDQNKITMLQQGDVPIYEPGLKEVVAINVKTGRLSFTTDVENAINQAEIIVIAVGTPSADDGSADLRAVYSVVESIAQNLNNHKIIVTKSTVPIGTGKQIRSLLEKKYGIKSDMFDIVSNPEFLREGTAIADFLKPDRLVIGTESDTALKIMCEVYEPLLENGTAHVLTNVVTAETIKYAANAFLATKLSYINEIANLCDAINADVKTIAYALGLDERISPKFLKPGPGFGGSCFPKDTQALLYMARQHDIEIHTVQAAIEANKIQQLKPVEKLINLMKTNIKSDTIKGKTIAVLGLAFKANTDDIRYSPAIQTIKTLLQNGLEVRAYDPAAMENMKHEFPNITYCETMYDAVTGVDAIVVMTEWNEFKHMDLSYVAQLVNHRILVDARNILNPVTLKKLDFVCDAIGQSYLYKNNTHFEYMFVPIHVVNRSTLSRLR